MTPLTVPDGNCRDRLLERLPGAQRLDQGVRGGGGSGRDAGVVEHHHLADLDLLGLAELLDVVLVVAAQVLLFELDLGVDLAPDHPLESDLLLELGAELLGRDARLRQRAVELLVVLELVGLAHAVDRLRHLVGGDGDLELVRPRQHQQLLEQVPHDVAREPAHELVARGGLLGHARARGASRPRSGSRSRRGWRCGR